jgi:hypothetical protein
MAANWSAVAVMMFVAFVLLCGTQLDGLGLGLGDMPKIALL